MKINKCNKELLIDYLARGEILLNLEQKVLDNLCLTNDTRSYIGQCSIDEWEYNLQLLSEWYNKIDLRFDHATLIVRLSATADFSVKEMQALDTFRSIIVRSQTFNWGLYKSKLSEPELKFSLILTI